ncbi:hypothetical protein GWO43_12655, partial [candidate division KSB1 bacterium]|nr:hypothetical protein [candidate division KSB1 bacterium]NIR71276.1 hypothetical protein [candidate division KSB1 bacterium]NIS24805.1 hypothetical protein [candidate division KSB1 bacterium]NIT71712.1 hypothetical protein [candidate division KSB1 bacterium]NIU25441.1 hypothetical protein [candidate division KSB1 bacterium]
MSNHTNSNCILSRFLLGVALAFLIAPSLWPQTEPIEGIRENTPQVHALINARIVQAPDRVIEKGTVVLRDGVIEAVGANVSPPADARIWDYEGMTIYPGLIEPYSQLGLPKEKKGNQENSGNSKKDTETTAADHWNPNVHPELHAMDVYQPKAKDIEKLRSLGFTAAVITPNEGIFSGSGAVVSLADGPANDQLLRDNVSQNIMFKRPGGFRSRTYPNSLMGVIALIRQTFLDAQWYQKAQQAYASNPRGQDRPEANASLEALASAIQGTQPVLFNVENDLNFLRALKVIKEFG